MILSKKMYTKVAITLTILLGMGSLSFAGNTVSDVPASASEMRTIQTETTLYTDSCDIEQDLAFYDGSPVYLRIAQPKGPVNYVFDKAETYVRLYGDVFGWALKFPYITNMVPSTTLDTANTTILTVEAKDGTFDASSMTIDQDEVAGQIISNNMERSLILNSNWAALNYYYRRTSDYSLHNWTHTAIINPNVTKKIACTNYYVARCGDWVIDDANSDGIEVDGDTIERHSQSLTPSEVCDDGDNNGEPWYCNSDCTGMGTGTTPTGWATCSLIPSSISLEPGESITLDASYTSWESATFTPTTTGMDNFTYPTWSGTAVVSPTTTTTYTLNVDWSGDLDDATCSTTITVVEPEPHLECTLTLSPSIAGTGQVINVGWNVSNGTFHSTYIFVTPSVVWARPHLVSSNDYNGVTTVTPTSTGEYVFTMNVANEDEQATCTGILNIVDPVWPCTLTTTTPIIYPGQTGNLSASYFNASLATFSPSIAWLNLVYPHRSNSGIIVQPTDTTTYTLDVLGVNGSAESCSTTIMVMNTGLQLSKSLVANTMYHSGDLVTFKIDFSNNWVNTIDNVVLSDYLPASLEYVNSQLYGVTPPYNFGTGIVGSNEFVEYSGFSLAPGQNGYMLIMGRFKWYAYSNQTLNNAFAKGDNTPLVYASALFYAYSPTSNATAIKTSNKTSYLPGEAAQFTIAVTNNGPDAINSMTITDNRPAGSCVNLDSARSSNMPLTVASTSNPYSWTFNGTLWVGQTIYLYLTGNISNDVACVGNYVNNANISYVTNGSTYTGSALPLNFSVSATPSSTMFFEKRLISYGTNPWDPVVFELHYRNNWSATIANYDIIDYRPGTLNFVSASPMPTTQTMGTGWLELHWIMNTPLAANWSGTITINGTIK